MRNTPRRKRLANRAKARRSLPLNLLGTVSQPIDLSPDDDTSREWPTQDTAGLKCEERGSSSPYLAPDCSGPESDSSVDSDSGAEERSTANDEPWLCFVHTDDSLNHGAYPGIPLKKLPLNSIETGIWIGSYDDHNELVQEMASYNDLIQRSTRKELLDGVQTYMDTAKSYMSPTNNFVLCRRENCFDHEGRQNLGERTCVQSCGNGGSKIGRHVQKRRDCTQGW